MFSGPICGSFDTGPAVIAYSNSSNFRLTFQDDYNLVFAVNEMVDQDQIATFDAVKRTRWSGSNVGSNPKVLTFDADTG